MKVLLNTPKFAVIDEVLPQDQFDLVWLHTQNENYVIPHLNGQWMKVWRPNDGVSFASNCYMWSKRPWNNYLDGVAAYLVKTAEHFPNLTGTWTDISFRTYIYPRNTKLSWHNDAATYSAAMTYYLHPKWNSTWGGELFVAEVPEMSELKLQPQAAPHLDHAWEDEYIGTVGLGSWVAPKPNRVVLMQGGTYHCINRVDEDAGDNPRVTLVVFFLNK